MEEVIIDSITLGKVIGVFLVIFGLSLLVRHSGWQDRLEEVRKNPALYKVGALLELLVGLVIIFFHPVWVIGWEVIITIVGWLLVLEAVICLFVSADTIGGWLKKVNRISWYVVVGVVSLILGLYIIWEAFGLAGAIL